MKLLFTSFQSNVDYGSRKQLHPQKMHWKYSSSINKFLPLFEFFSEKGKKFFSAWGSSVFVNIFNLPLNKFK